MNKLERLSPCTSQLGERYDRLYSRDVGGTRITCKRDRETKRWRGVLTGLSCERYRIASAVHGSRLSVCFRHLMADARRIYPSHAEPNK